MGIKGVSRNHDYGRHILAYYRERPGQDLHYRDVAEAMPSGVMGDTSIGNVATYLSRVVERHPGWGFSRTGSGVYRFVPPENRPEEKTVPPMVEIVGFMDDDITMIVRDENGKLSLWRRVEMP